MQAKRARLRSSWDDVGLGNFTVDKYQEENSYVNATSKIGNRIVLTLALALVSVAVIGILAVVPAYAQGPWGGRGMMGGWNTGGYQGCGGYGVTGPCGDTYPQGTTPQNTATLTMDEVKAAVDRYLSTWNDDDLQVVEVMEFSYNFYALVEEKSSGMGAFEVLVDRTTGAVRPEPGPNMMWNLKYGMMSGRGHGMMGGWGPGYAPTTQMPVDEAQARQSAQSYLDRTMPGATLSEHAVAFYGYYTIDVEQDGEDVGMLSVNGYGGQVWYHTWHGAFVQEQEWD